MQIGLAKLSRLDCRRWDSSLFSKVCSNKVSNKWPHKVSHKSRRFSKDLYNLFSKRRRRRKHHSKLFDHPSKVFKRQLRQLTNSLCNKPCCNRLKHCKIWFRRSKVCCHSNHKYKCLHPSRCNTYRHCNRRIRLCQAQMATE